MKTLSLALISFLALTVSLPLHAQTDQAALNRFQKDLEAIDVAMKQEFANVKTNPMSGVMATRKMAQRFKSVETTGLPADLKEEYIKFTGVVAKFGEFYDGWPEEPQEIPAFLKSKLAENPKYREEMDQKMAKLRGELDPVTKRLEELSKKYNLKLPTPSFDGK